MRVLLLICLVASCYTFQMKNQKLNTLAGTSFGNLFAQIKEQIRAGGPMANVMGLLDELEDQIRDEQARHVAMLNRNKDSCSAEEAFRTNEINDGTSALRRAENHLAACSASLAQTKVNHAQTVQDIADSEAALATATQRRAEGAALFALRQQDHRQALGVVKGALSILDDLVAEESSLVQLSAHTSNLLRTGVKISLASKYAPVIAMFAQMATSEVDMFLDAGAVERVRGMLNQLYANVEESLTDYTNEENSSIENYTNLKAKLEQSIRDLNANKQALEDHWEEMVQCVLEEELLVSKSHEKINRNTKLRDLSRSMCEAFVQEYEAATSGRDEELKLLSTVRKMVRRRLDGVASSVVDRDDEFVNEEVEDYQGASFDHDGGDRADALEGYGL